MGGFDAFLDLKGIKGESKDADHAGMIDIESFSFGGSNRGVTAGAAGADGRKGIVELSNLCLTKHTDAATPLIFKALVEGKPISKAVLMIRKAGGGQKEFMRYTLEDVYVSSQHINSSHGSEQQPIENFCLNFRKIQIKYSEQTEKGSTTGGIIGEHDLGKTT